MAISDSSGGYTWHECVDISLTQICGWFQNGSLFFQQYSDDSDFQLILESTHVDTP